METKTMEQTKEEQALEELITINGGVELEVVYRNNGQNETVKVRQIPISKISSFVMALSNEAQAIELYCDKPAGWADTLTMESASAIADKGQELNIPFFAAWFRRQMKWRESQADNTITDTRSRNESSNLTQPSSALGNSLPQ